MIEGISKLAELGLKRRKQVESNWQAFLMPVPTGFLLHRVSPTLQEHAKHGDLEVTYWPCFGHRISTPVCEQCLIKYGCERWEEAYNNKKLQNYYIESGTSSWNDDFDNGLDMKFEKVIDYKKIFIDELKRDLKVFKRYPRKLSYLNRPFNKPPHSLEKRFLVKKGLALPVVENEELLDPMTSRSFIRSLGNLNLVICLVESELERDVLDADELLTEGEFKLVRVGTVFKIKRKVTKTHVKKRKAE